MGDPWDDEFELMNSIALLSYLVHVHNHLRPLMAKIGACETDNLGGLSQSLRQCGSCPSPALIAPASRWSSPEISDTVATNPAHKKNRPRLLLNYSTSHLLLYSIT
jgi:hypothetical protein